MSASFYAECARKIGYARTCAWLRNKAHHYSRKSTRAPAILRAVFYTGWISHLCSSHPVTLGSTQLSEQSIVRLLAITRYSIYNSLNNHLLTIFSVCQVSSFCYYFCICYKIYIFCFVYTFCVVSLSTTLPMSFGPSLS